MTKFLVKTKFLKLWTKNAFFGFEISLFEFVKWQSFVQKQKSLNLEPKMFDLIVTGLEFKNAIAIFQMKLLKIFQL